MINGSIDTSNSYDDYKKMVIKLRAHANLSKINLEANFVTGTDIFIKDNLKTKLIKRSIKTCKAH